MPLVLKQPDYFETCKNAYLAKTTTVAPGANIYAVPFTSNGIKAVGVAEQRSATTITASGAVFKMVSKHTATNLGIDAIALDQEFVRWALAHVSDANGGFSFGKGTDKPTEFAFGCTFAYASGLRVFQWYPRCVLSNGDKSVKDPGTTATDPSTPYSIVALPYGANDLIYIEYDQSLVLATKNPLTEDVFFATVVSTITDIRVGTETAKV